MSGSDPKFEEFLAAYIDADAAAREALLAAHPEYAERVRWFADNERWLRDPVPVGDAMPPTLDAGAVPPGPVRVRYVGDYEILGELARGAMGVVYRARQMSLRREVALKMVLAGEYASDDQLRRFRAEAEAAANLDHPNIVPVYEVGVHEGQPYFTMKLIEGKSLAQAMPELKGRPREAAALLAKAARAVHHAHQRGVLHRDIKPGNILLDAEGSPHVADFGLARRGEGGASVSGAVVGTPAYMPPEQARAERGLTVAADVWALGAVLYEMLSGRPPFGGDNALEVLRAVVHDDPAPLSGDLGVVALKCLEKESGKRYASAAELADELERWLRGEPILARPAGTMERLWCWCRRNRAAVALICVLMMATVSASLLTWWALSEKGRADGEADLKDKEAIAARKAEKEAKEQKEAADIQALRAEDARHAFQISVALRAWEQYDVAEAERVLGEVQPRFQPSWETRHVRSLCRRKAMPLTGHSAGVFGVAYSPDGTRIASAGEDKTVKLWDAHTGEKQLTLKGHADGVRSVAFSPDGSRIVSGSVDKTVRVWDARTGKEMLSLKGHASWVMSVAYSPDGTRIASGGGEPGKPGELGEVKVWDVRTGKKLLSFEGHQGTVNGVAYSPDGMRVASASEDETVRVWDARTGKEMLSLKGHASWVMSVAYSPDGTRIASGSWDGTVRVWDAHTGKEKLSLTGHARQVWGVTYSPDGKRIVSAGSGVGDTSPHSVVPDLDDRSPGEVRVWNSETGQESLTLKGHADSVLSVAFSPAGDRILTGSMDSAVKVWNLDSRNETLALAGNERAGLSVTRVAFSPDGKRLLTSSRGHLQNGDATVWDAVSGRKALTLSAFAAAYSPDGKHIVGGTSLDDLISWHAGTGEMEHQRPYRRGIRARNDLIHVAYSPDCTRIVASAEKGVTVLDARLMEERLTLDGASGPVAYSPDGTSIAAASGEKTVKVWDARTGKVDRSLNGHTGRVRSLAYSPDGRHIATASEDKTVRVWDSRTGKEMHSLVGHRGGVLDVAYSPDGSRIASASTDRTVKLWNPQTGLEKISLRGHMEWGTSVAFSPDGWRLVSVSEDNTVRVWDAEIPRPEGHSALAAESEQMKSWPAAAFHLERLHRSDPTARPRLLAALKQADDSPLTRSIKRNLAATDAARAASSLFLPPLARPAPLPGR